MTGLNDNMIVAAWSYTPPTDSAEPLLLKDTTFTRSNGSIVSRIYERLTKASRRGGRQLGEQWEMAYRRGVYDAYKALQEELEV